MLEMPDFSRSWEYENNFYLSCDPTRMSNLLAHYELMPSGAGPPGAARERGRGGPGRWEGEARQA